MLLSAWVDVVNQSSQLKCQNFNWPFCSFLSSHLHDINFSDDQILDYVNCKYFISSLGEVSKEPHVNYACIIFVPEPLKIILHIFSTILYILGIIVVCSKSSLSKPKFHTIKVASSSGINSIDTAGLLAFFSFVVPSMEHILHMQCNSVTSLHHYDANLEYWEIHFYSGRKNDLGFSWMVWYGTHLLFLDIWLQKRTKWDSYWPIYVKSQATMSLSLQRPVSTTTALELTARQCSYKREQHIGSRESRLCFTSMILDAQKSTVYAQWFSDYEIFTFKMLLY